MTVRWRCTWAWSLPCCSALPRSASLAWRRSTCSTRTKQIGTRRAVGARRTDILRYFLAENWLITSVGVVVGCILALLLGYWLSTTFELPRLKLYYLLAGVVVLWSVSLAAALRPARRASMVSPAIATRTV